MTIVEIPSEAATEIAVTPRITYVHLNSDGTYEDANSIRADVFIEEDQLKKLGDASIAEYIRNTCGHIVGILHRKQPVLMQPMVESRMFVL